MQQKEAVASWRQCPVFLINLLSNTSPVLVKSQDTRRKRLSWGCWVCEGWAAGETSDRGKYGFMRSLPERKTTQKKKNVLQHLGVREKFRSFFWLGERNAEKKNHVVLQYSSEQRIAGVIGNQRDNLLWCYQVIFQLDQLIKSVLEEKRAALNKQLCGDS